MLLETPLHDLGWSAEPFALKDPDGKTHSSDTVVGENGLLIGFICNHCPYVKAIADRLAEDARTLQAAGIGVLAVMSNDYKAYNADRPELMKEFAQQHGFTFPYLVDEDQSVGKLYGAVCTPDFFGFNRDGKLCYRGRLDDAAMGDATSRTPELVNAMQLVAESGAGPAEQFPSIGCSIKWRE